jgi:LacI family transcriptional regulator
LNKEAHVREDKRGRVQAAIEQLGYRPNLAARTLSGARSYMMAFLAPEGARLYIDQQLRGVLAACQKSGYHLVVEFFNPETEDVCGRVRAQCTSTRRDGAVLAPGLCDMPEGLALLDVQGIAHVGI